MSNNLEIGERSEIASATSAKAEIEFASVHIADEPIASPNDVGITKPDLTQKVGDEITEVITGIREPEPKSNANPNKTEGMSPKKTGWRKFLERLGSWLGDKDKVKWMKKMRGSLSMAVSIIAGITFQAATNPPGGIVRASPNDNFDCDDSNGDRFCPGHAALAIVYPDSYLQFLISNTISFIGSLSVGLLLVSGLSLQNRFTIWLLCIGMCITISSLAYTYLIAASLVTPNIIWDPATGIWKTVLLVWVSLLALVAFVLVIRLLVFVVNKLIKISTKESVKRDKVKSEIDTT